MEDDAQNEGRYILKKETLRGFNLIFFLNLFFLNLLKKKIKNLKRKGYKICKEGEGIPFSVSTVGKAAGNPPADTVGKVHFQEPDDIFLTRRDEHLWVRPCRPEHC